jgi:hypothetical protein
MRSRTIRRTLRTVALAAASTVAAMTLAAPAAAQPATAGSVLPTRWNATLGAASAGGTVTFRQDPLGIMGHWTVKGAVTAPGDDCYYVQITAGRTWNSTPACGSGQAPSFTVTFDAPVLTSSGTARLCAARPEPDVCGAPATLW